MNLSAELKRRNVFRASAACLALGWVVTQVTSIVAPALHLPDRIVPVVVWIGVIGFPFVIVFSRVFELTSEGIGRERDIEQDASIKHITARRLGHLAIGLFALAIVLLAADRFFVRASAPAPASAPAAAAVKDTAVAPNAGASQKSTPPASDKSIAVLPFADLSPGHDQEHFSDRMAEEILDALAQVQDLKVAGRPSSFFFKCENETLQVIGAALGVAHVPEGSVLGRNDLALAELERLFAANDPLREFLYAIPQFEPLHRDPRFQALLRQVNLPQPAREEPGSP